MTLEKVGDVSVHIGDTSTDADIADSLARPDTQDLSPTFENCFEYPDKYTGKQFRKLPTELNVLINYNVSKQKLLKNYLSLRDTSM